MGTKDDQSWVTCLAGWLLTLERQSKLVRQQHCVLISLQRMIFEPYDNAESFNASHQCFRHCCAVNLQYHAIIFHVSFECKLSLYSAPLKLWQEQNRQKQQHYQCSLIHKLLVWAVIVVLNQFGKSLTEVNWPEWLLNHHLSHWTYVCR